MEDIKIFTFNDIESKLIPAAGQEAGWFKRIIYPHNVVTRGIFFGIAEVNPGYSPHRWHNHAYDKAEGYEMICPEGFEDFYYIISGSGVLQWETKDGNIEEEKIGAGDAIFFPAGVVKHQLLNNGAKKIFMVFGGFPTAKVVDTRKLK